MFKLIAKISKFFAALLTFLNYFDGLIKLLSDLYLIKFFNIFCAKESCF